jgi:ATP-dependent DNA helicase RecG
VQSDDLLVSVHKILSQSCESQTIEVKAARSSRSTRLFDTLSAFSNRDEGGIIVLDWAKTQVMRL